MGDTILRDSTVSMADALLTCCSWWKWRHHVIWRATAGPGNNSLLFIQQRITLSSPCQAKQAGGFMPSLALQKGFALTASLFRLKAEEEITKDSPLPPYFWTPPIWLVCSCHLGILQSHPSSSLVLLFQDPWVVLGDAFTEGVVFIDFLGKLILIANTWGPFLKPPLPPQSHFSSSHALPYFSTLAVWAFFQGYWNKNWRISFKVPRR